jgi:hypothetical protein
LRSVNQSVLTATGKEHTAAISTRLEMVGTYPTTHPVPDTPPA